MGSLERFCVGGPYHYYLGIFQAMSMFCQRNISKYNNNWHFASSIRFFVHVASFGDIYIYIIHVSLLFCFVLSKTLTELLWMVWSWHLPFWSFEWLVQRILQTSNLKLTFGCVTLATSFRLIGRIKWCNINNGVLLFAGWAPKIINRI